MQRWIGWPRETLACAHHAALPVEGRRQRGLGRALLEKGIVHHILWAASRADQTCADAYIAGGWHRAFTYYFCKEMLACNNSLSRERVLAKVRRTWPPHITVKLRSWSARLPSVP